MPTSIDSLIESSHQDNRLLQFVVANPLIMISIIIGVILLAISVVLYTVYLQQSNNPIEIVETDTQEIMPKELIADVSGAVETPGVYAVPVGTRLHELIDKAGGFREDANQEWVQKQLNLAAEVTDGMKIYIPFVGEEIATPQEVLGTATQISNLINLNTATAEELDSLPTIGPATAAKIIEYRKSHQFSSIDELTEVEGIGEKTVEKIKEFVSVK